MADTPHRRGDLAGKMRNSLWRCTVWSGGVNYRGRWVRGMLLILWGTMGALGVAVVVEDDHDVRNLLEGMLSRIGFEVHTAVDGVSGLETVKAIQPALVTLDVGLPDMDGVEVLRRMRGLSDAYIVMLTGRTGEAEILNAKDAGADEYITKPFRPKEVRERIEAMMATPRSLRPATS